MDWALAEGKIIREFEQHMAVSVEWFKKKCSSSALFKAAFTRQTKVGKLVLANSSWRV